MKRKQLIAGVALFLMLQLAFAAPPQVSAQTTYQPTWNSLKNARTPQWLRDGKFGIYTHWGVYAVPAQGPNATWYANQLYTKADLMGLFFRVILILFVRC